MIELVVMLFFFVAMEGLLYAAFPVAMKKAMAEVSQMSSEMLRLAGLICALVGVCGVAIVRFAL
jgi:uncharacterized protein YjeT (DUF2065 family)